MPYHYRKASEHDIALLACLRSVALRAANKLPDDYPMPVVEQNARDYYQRTMANDSHISYIVYDKDTVVGTGGVSFYELLPTFSNPGGQYAFLMNIYTDPAYRRRGIAEKTVNILVQEAKARGVGCISLDATDMGRPLYEKYGFAPMPNMMKLK